MVDDVKTQLGVAALILAVAATVGEKIGHRSLLRRQPSTSAYQLGFNLGALLLLTAANLHFTRPTFALLLPLLISGALWYLSNLLSFRADRVCGLIGTTIASQSQLIFTTLGGALFFHERVGFAHAVALMLIFVGMGLGLPRRSGSRVGVGLKFLSTLGKAGALLIDKGLAGAVAAPVIAASAYALPLVLGLLTAPSAYRYAYAYARSVRFANCALGALSALGYLLLIQALAGLPVSVAMPLYQANYVVVIWLAHRILREDIARVRSLWSSGLTTLGCILISCLR